MYAQEIQQLMHTKTKLTAVVILLFSTLFYSICIAQNSGGGASSVSDNNIQISHEREKDATRLTILHLSQQEDLSDVIAIPDDIKSSLYKALTTIYNSNNSHAKKVSKLDIHTQPEPFYIDHLNVNCHIDTDWLTPIEKGNPMTSNKTINNLIETYNLKISNYNKENKSFTISAYPHINMNALAKQLSKIEGVVVSIPKVHHSDNNIKVEKVGKDTWMIIYEKQYFGKNKTPYKKQWSFSVDAAENVIFLDEMTISDR